MKKEIQKKNLDAVQSKTDYIINLTLSPFFIFLDIKISELVEKLEKEPSISVIAIVDEQFTPRGIITRKKLFDIFGKHFGKEVIANKTIKDLLEQNHFVNPIEQPPVFLWNQNIFSIANQLDISLNKKEIQYYLLINQEKEFMGICSNIDILFYISSQTKEDIKTAREVQNSIVKENFSLKKDCFEIAAFSMGAREMNGDFYAVNELPSNQWIFSICDVSGKGVSSSLITAILGSFFEMVVQNTNLEKDLIKLNQYIYQAFQIKKYITGIFFIFDKKNRTIDLYDMGHSYLYLVRKGKWEKIISFQKNFPIGIQPDIQLKKLTLELHQNDLLVCLTDGIIEQKNDKSETYTLEHFMELILTKEHDSISDLSQILANKFRLFRGKEPQYDDATMLLFSFHPKE